MERYRKRDRIYMYVCCLGINSVLFFDVHPISYYISLYKSRFWHAYQRLRYKVQADWGKTLINEIVGGIKR